MKKNTIFVSDLKVRTIFPFFIDNINNNFFGSLKKYHNKVLNKKIASKLSNLKLDELKKIKDIENISSNEMIKLLIDRVIKKIVAKTGNKKCDFFVEKSRDKNGNPIFVEIKNELHDFEIIGNLNKQRRHIYAIDVNKQSYLFNYVEQIQVTFYLDEKNKMISGGISWNWGNDNKPDSTENLVDKVYINSFVKYFITREFNDISLSSLISILEEKSDSKKDNDDDNKLKQVWNDLVYKKILKNNVLTDKEKKYYLNDLYYSILNLLIISLIICEELKIYFRHQTPEMYQPLLKKFVTTNDDLNNDAKQDYEQLIIFSKKNYLTIYNTHIKEILNQDDPIQALIKFYKHDTLYFGESLLSYEIIRNSDIPFLDEDDDIFMNNNNLKILYLLSMDPRMFGVHYSTGDFIKYCDLVNMIKKIDFSDQEWNKVLNEKIDVSVCEWNYNYISFINEDLSFLIIKNNNNNVNLLKTSKKEFDPNRKLFNNYLWAQIYVNAIIYKMKNRETKFKENKSKYPFLLREYIYDVEKLHFDWYDDFYGLPQLKKIIKKIDNFKHLNKSITNLNRKIQREDKAYGKSKERKNVAFAFITASIFGVVDFLTMIYTVLTVSNPSAGFKPIENIVAISIGGFLATIMLGILLYTLLTPIIKRKQYKKKG